MVSVPPWGLASAVVEGPCSSFSLGSWGLGDPILELLPGSPRGPPSPGTVAWPYRLWARAVACCGCGFPPVASN